jgi:hypothetical protein
MKKFKIKPATAAKLGAAIVSIQTLFTGLPAGAQSVAPIVLVMEDLKIQGQNGKTFHFKILQDACGIHYMMNGGELSEWLFAFKKYNVTTFGYEAVQSSVKMLRAQALKADILRQLGLPNAAFQTETPPALSDFGLEHYKVNGQDVYVKDGKVVAKAVYDARVAQIYNMSRTIVDRTKQCAHQK